MGHDNDMSKSFERMTDDVRRVARWGRKRVTAKEKLNGACVCPEQEVGLGRECGLGLVWCLESCDESCFDFKPQWKTV